MKANKFRVMAALAAAALTVASCGDDDDTPAVTLPDVTVPDVTIPDVTVPDVTIPDVTVPDVTAPDVTIDDTDTTDTRGATGTTGGTGTATDLDTNGDGRVQFGIAAAGPRDDGAYYEAVVIAATELAEENGFEEPIVVDNIQAADAATSIGDLAQQGVDVIIVGASEIAEPLPQLIEEYPDVFWYCNCGAGFPEDEGLAQSTDNGAEIGYTAGYATGLLMQDGEGTSAAFIGCCDLGFEKQSYLAFEAGLAAVDASYTMTYIPTGDFPFDFDNTANATAALQTAVDEGVAAVYPFLGGAHRPVVQAAEEAGLITMSAGSSTVCDEAEELDYDIAVRFDGGDYLRAVMADIVSGDLKEGDTKTFEVGVDPEPGAVICDATPEQQDAMDAVYDDIAAGELEDLFGEIAGQAFAE